MTRRPLVNVNGVVHELPQGDLPYPFTQTMLDFLSHCSVSATGEPLWDGVPFLLGLPGNVYVVTGYVENGYVD